MTEINPMPEPYFDRFWSNVIPEPNCGCWLWIGPSVSGYGYMDIPGRSNRAHRLSYEHYVGKIPSGLEIDHLCRVRCCVNPQHLEPVTSAENTRRGTSGLSSTIRAAARACCPQGHPYAGDNLYVTPYGTRQCRTCRNNRTNEYRARCRSRGDVK